MGFRENLKSELVYADMRVKELAKLSGIKKSTIDSYLRENNYSPSVETAVCIARALGVSVEYLVLGEEATINKATVLQNPDMRLLLQLLEKLTIENQKIIIKNALNLSTSLLNKTNSD